MYKQQIMELNKWIHKRTKSINKEQQLKGQIVK